MLRFSGVGVTDVGRVREHNEDSGYLGPSLALVADGVGGAAAGEVASATAAHVVADRITSRRLDDVTQVLAPAVAEARDRILAGGAADPSRAGMATTLTALATDGRTVALAHVGDSRAYRHSAGRLTQVSTDHSYVQQLVDHGRLDPQQARVHPWRNILLRSLSAARPSAGDDGGGEADITTVEVEPGDRLLVCSDGLTDLVEDVEVAAILGRHDAGGAARELLATALEAGGSDNITCLVLDVTTGPWAVGNGQLLGALRHPGNIVGPDANGRSEAVPTVTA